jgi:hypothetical protein
MHSAKHAVGVQVVIFCLAACGLLTTPAGAQAPAAVPVFKITPVESTIKFHVAASPAAESAVLDVQIQAANVNTGSGLKDGTLKSEDFSTSIRIR